MSNNRTQPPVISIKLELEPNVFHFSDARPPTLSLHIRSSASRTITIEVGNGTPLDPKSAMGQGGYPTTDLSTSPPTSLKMSNPTCIYRPMGPPKQYLTIDPGQVTTLSVAFTRGGSYEPFFRPQPWEIVRRGRMLDENGNEMNVRRQIAVAGCDGLEVGKKYKVSAAVEKLIGRSWWWGTKEEVQSGNATVPVFEEDGEELRLFLEYVVEDGGFEFSVQE